MIQCQDRNDLISVVCLKRFFYHSSIYYKMFHLSLTVYCSNDNDSNYKLLWPLVICYSPENNI